MSLCCGGPSYKRVGVELSTKLRRPNSVLHTLLKHYGAPKTLNFKGVGPGGYDIYAVQFEHGSAEARIDFAPDGTLEDLNLRADGNSSPGAVVGCSLTTSLTSPQDAIPIQIAITNRSGAELDIYNPADFQRLQRHSAVPDGGLINLTTGVEQPLVVSDPAGRCLDIILPGQTTRSNIIGPHGVLVSFRRTAFPGGAELLGQYLDSVQRGASVYDHMTPEAAATAYNLATRRRAILDKLGTLQEIRFQGVSDSDEDIYRTRFANGWAEWRIAFAKDGRLSSIAVGPMS